MKTQKQKQNTQWTTTIVVFLIMAFVALGVILKESAKMQTDYFMVPSLVESILWGTAGLLVMLLCSYVNVKQLQRWVPVVAIAALVSLILLITPLGVEIYGARRWLKIGNITIQPSELMIPAHILVTAKMIKYFHAKGTKQQLLVWTWGAAAVTGFLTSSFTSNLNPMVIIPGITFFMTLVFAEMVPFHLVFLGTAITSFTLFVAGFANRLGEETYRMTRLKAWLNPYEYADSYGFQAVKQLEAVNSGGWFGKGFGKGGLMESFSGAYNDSLFSILCEDFGWIAAGLLVFALLVLLYELYKILKLAMKSRNTFFAALVMGVLAHVGLCSFIYIARNLNLLPNGTGRLPFIGTRGVSDLFIYCEIGLVLAVNKACRKTKENV